MKKLTPNYTKSTTSTDARRRGKNLKMDRAPCSYSRCSLNDAVLPPLKSFVSARRQAQARPSGKLIGRDEAATSDGDMWSDIDPRSWVQDQEAETEILRRQMKEESGEQGCKIITSAHELIMSTSDERLGNFFDEDHPLEHDQVSNQSYHTNNIQYYQQECNVVHQVNPRNMEMPETEDKTSMQAAAKHDMSNLQEADEPTCFNPHFLPLEADPEAEKVRLRHQEVDARKNGEEWMVDYALREGIGPTRQRKVASLVEAFERLLPTTKT